MSAGEQKFFRDYVKLIDEYSKNVGLKTNGKLSGFDLTVDLSPPKDLFVEVRVVQDLGDFYLPESGVVNLQKNTTHLLRKSECENLIKRGVVALVQRN